MLETLGRTDIYLIDQMMRGRILPGMKVLDAGCGSGRNSEFLVNEGYDVSGFDLSRDVIQHVHQIGTDWGEAFEPNNFKVGNLVDIPFSDQEFDFVICMAVLHFAENRAHFSEMIRELVRVLKPKGILWFRMTTKHTIVHLAQHVDDDVYSIPDGSTRYLLDRSYLEKLMVDLGLEYADTFKTVNVNDIRSMCVVALRKEV